MKPLAEYLIWESYHYDKKHFNPSDCLTWLIATKKLKAFSNSFDIEEYAKMAQYAAEDEGIPTEDAEQVFDEVYNRFNK